MKNKIALITFSILFFFFIISCNDNSTEPKDEITIKPIVIKSSINYNKDSFRTSFPDLDLNKNIADAYKDKYSQEIKAQMIDYMKNQVKMLGENEDTFIKCMDLTGCKDINSISLPTYAEKAKYDGEDAWIIQLIWASRPENIGHYKCFAIGINQIDTLDFIRCL